MIISELMIEFATWINHHSIRFKFIQRLIQIYWIELIILNYQSKFVFVAILRTFTVLNTRPLRNISVLCRSMLLLILLNAFQMKKKKKTGNNSAKLLGRCYFNSFKMQKRLIFFDQKMHFAIKCMLQHLELNIILYFVPK